MSKNIDLKAGPIAVAIALSLSTTGSVIAQESVFALEEIVVTARKVEESLQDVPLSITAFSADDIKTRSIDELEDIAMLTPGLSYEDFSNGAYGTPIIRGASQFSLVQLEQNVSTFIDGVYIPRQYAVDTGTLGIERIEVVKGPQSALYGANAFMGAINYVTTQADLEEFDASVGVTFGGDERKDLSGEVSIPVLPGQLAIRLAAGTTEYDGDWVNEHPEANSGISPGTDGKLGGWDNDSYSISLVAAPSDALNIEIGYGKYEVSTETRAQSRITLAGGDLNCSFTVNPAIFNFTPSNKAYCGELPSTPLAAGTTDEIGFVIDPRSYGVESSTDIMRAKFDFALSDTTTLSYQFGNVEGEVFSAGGSDRDALVGTTNTQGTIFDPSDDTIENVFTVLPVGNFDYDTHEFRIESNSDSGLYWMVGAFLSDGEDFDYVFGQGGIFEELYAGQDLEPILASDNPLSEATLTKTTTEAQALFGRVSVPIGEAFIFSAEGRYTDEEKSVLGVDDIYEDSYFNPRVSLDYNFSDDQMIYISAATGVKSGGRNPDVGVEFEPEEIEYAPDENTTFELGSKNILLDGRLQLNATAYLIDWSDLQVSAAAINATTGFTRNIIRNLGSAESTGIEVDMLYAITDSFTLRAGLALNDATYDEGTISQRLVRSAVCSDADCTEGATGDIGGNTLPRSSDTQWNLGAQYNGTFDGGLEYFLSTDIAGQSEQYVGEANLATIPSRTLVNLSAGINSENWSAELWVKNAGDKEYVANAFYIPNPFFVDYVPTWGAKRRVGLTLDYSF